MSNGLLMVWTDIPANVEDDFNDWYNREHVRERVDVPGFIRSRRFVATSGAPKYLALYETENLQVLQSEPYLRFKIKRDERTLEMTRLFRNTIKVTGNVIVRAGRGEGAFLVVLPIAVERTRRTAFAEWLRGELFAKLIPAPGIASAIYVEHDATTRGVAAPLDVRTGDRHTERALFIEATTERGVTEALAALDPRRLHEHGAQPHLVEKPATFRVLYALHA